MSHSPGTSNQNQPSSPKPMRLVQDLPGAHPAFGVPAQGLWGPGAGRGDTGTERGWTGHVWRYWRAGEQS